MTDTPAANRNALRASLQERLGSAHWRQRPVTAEELTSLLEEARREHTRFEQILEQARDNAVPMPDLFLQTSRLASPDMSDEFLQDALLRYGRMLEAGSAPHLGGQDAGLGNPAWITLTLPERGELPSVLRFDDKNTGEEGKTEEHSGLFGLIIRVLQRLAGQKSAPPQSLRLRQIAGEQNRQSPDAKLPSKPSPLWGFVRMLLLGAALALVFHFLSRRGLAPKIF